MLRRVKAGPDCEIFMGDILDGFGRHLVKDERRRPL
jgi:hypothetical protein